MVGTLGGWLRTRILTGTAVRRKPANNETYVGDTHRALVGACGRARLGMAVTGDGERGEMTFVAAPARICRVAHHICDVTDKISMFILTRCTQQSQSRLILDLVF